MMTKNKKQKRRKEKNQRYDENKISTNFKSVSRNVHFRITKTKKFYFSLQKKNPEKKLHILQGDFMNGGEKSIKHQLSFNNFINLILAIRDLKLFIL